MIDNQIKTTLQHQKSSKNVFKTHYTSANIEYIIKTWWIRATSIHPRTMYVYNTVEGWREPLRMGERVPSLIDNSSHRCLFALNLHEPTPCAAI